MARTQNVLVVMVVVMVCVAQVRGQCPDGSGPGEDGQATNPPANVRLLRESSVKRASVLKQYDFVIVGASPSGCVLANRLSEVPEWNVLLIEAGEQENIFVQVPIFSAYLQSTSYNWGYLAEPQIYSCWGKRVVAMVSCGGASDIISPPSFFARFVVCRDEGSTVQLPEGEGSRGVHVDQLHDVRAGQQVRLRPVGGGR